MTGNVFSALSTYGSMETENYLTESFIYLLDLVSRRHPSACVSLLERLLGVRLDQGSQVPLTFEFSTQVMLEGGIPDIEIQISDSTRAFIEVKHDSRLGEGQLEYYKRLLDKSPQERKALVLLTRSKHSATDTTLASDEFHHVCWYEVHQWLRELSSEDDVIEFIKLDFLRFLEDKDMSLSRVEWEYQRGVPSLIDFTTMLEAAIGEVLTDLKLNRTAGWSWRGFYLDGRFFVGIRYSEPTILVFEDNQGNDPEFKVDFGFDENFFFSLDAGQQFEALIEHLRDIETKLPENQDEMNHTGT